MVFIAHQYRTLECANKHIAILFYQFCPSNHLSYAGKCLNECTNHHTNWTPWSSTRPPGFFLSRRHYKTVLSHFTAHCTDVPNSVTSVYLILCYVYGWQ